MKPLHPQRCVSSLRLREGLLLWTHHGSTSQNDSGLFLLLVGELERSGVCWCDVCVRVCTLQKNSAVLSVPFLSVRLIKQGAVEAPLDPRTSRWQSLIETRFQKLFFPFFVFFLHSALEYEGNNLKARPGCSSPKIPQKYTELSVHWLALPVHSTQHRNDCNVFLNTNKDDAKNADGNEATCGLHSVFGFYVSPWGPMLSCSA